LICSDSVLLWAWWQDEPEDFRFCSWQIPYTAYRRLRLILQGLLPASVFDLYSLAHYWLGESRSRRQATSRMVKILIPVTALSNNSLLGARR